MAYYSLVTFFNLNQLIFNMHMAHKKLVKNSVLIKLINLPLPSIPFLGLVLNVPHLIANFSIYYINHWYLMSICLRNKNIKYRRVVCIRRLAEGSLGSGLVSEAGRNG